MKQLRYSRDIFFGPLTHWPLTHKMANISTDKKSHFDAGSRHNSTWLALQRR